MWHQTLFLKNQNASIFENSFYIIHGKIHPTILSQVPRTPIFYENRINLVTLGYSFVDMLLWKTLVQHFSLVVVMSMLTILNFYLFLVFSKWCNWNSECCQTATLFGNPKFYKLQSKADALSSLSYFDWGSFTPIFSLVKGWGKMALHPLPSNSWNTYPIDLKLGINVYTNKNFQKMCKKICPLSKFCRS